MCKGLFKIEANKVDRTAKQETKEYLKSLALIAGTQYSQVLATQNERADHYRIEEKATE